MKKVFITWIFVLLACAGLHAQESFFEKFADRKGVTSVYISKRMFGMMKNIDSGNINLANVAGKINSMQILTCENKSVADELRKETAHIKPENGYEELIRVREEGERVTIYVKEGSKENEYVLLIDEQDEFTIILLNGQLTLEEIQGVIND
ncbi:DUF4252 domain-containing protein [uncultured Bacteroides sp.]|jgi:hypothetical protein|uniref:DUF4252 domain-containing protein n=1 Tax=uncultured Bacteroides sp. TaxID=162156 RepID=UPI0025E68D03|nr:DUF4252 domain-containing protein [uncultured Bacteroides sp.]